MRDRPAAGSAPGSGPALGEVAWEILLSLAGGDKHGYSILLDVQERTGGRLRLLPGSLYRALHRLVGDGCAVEVEGAAATRHDARRRVFRLTAAGRRALAAEARRLAGKVVAARRLGIPLRADEP